MSQSQTLSLRRSARIQERNVVATTTTAKKFRSSDESDGPMSRLPESVLQHLLFFLPVEDAVPLTAVSKSWHGAWSSLPTVSYRFYYNFHVKDAVLSEFLRSTYKTLQTLTKHRLVVESFAMTMVLPSPPHEGMDLYYAYHHLGQWLSLMMRNYVKVIDIRVYNSSNHLYLLPTRFFTTTRLLTKLHLEGCSILHVTFFTPYDERKQGFQFNCIKDITLINVEAMEDQFHSMLNCCKPFLEKLTIKACHSLENLFLDTFPKLFYVEVNVRVFKIRKSPKLVNLVLYGIKKARVFGCPNVMTLRFLTWEARHGYKSIERLVEKLHHLQTLQLFMTHRETIRVQSESVKTVLLYEGEAMGHQQEILNENRRMEVELETPNLAKLYYSGREMPVVRTIVELENVAVWQGQQEKLELYHLGHEASGGIDGMSLHKLGEYSRDFNHQQVVIFLQNIITTNLLGLEQLRNFPNVYYQQNIKSIALECIPASSNNYSSFLNCLLWSCHPKSLSISLATEKNLHSPYRNAFIKYLCNELFNKEINYGAVRCCRDHDRLAKCWRHYLADVKYVLYKSINYQEGIIQLPPQLTKDEIGKCVMINSSSKGIVLEFNFEWLPYAI